MWKEFWCTSHLLGKAFQWIVSNTQTQKTKQKIWNDVPSTFFIVLSPSQMLFCFSKFWSPLKPASSGRSHKWDCEELQNQSPSRGRNQWFGRNVGLVFPDLCVFQENLDFYVKFLEFWMVETNWIKGKTLCGPMEHTCRPDWNFRPPLCNFWQT